VPFVILWFLGFVILTVQFWKLYSASNINVYLSILTMVSPIISFIIYAVIGQYSPGEPEA